MTRRATDTGKEDWQRVRSADMSKVLVVMVSIVGTLITVICIMAWSELRQIREDSDLRWAKIEGDLKEIREQRTAMIEIMATTTVSVKQNSENIVKIEKRIAEIEKRIQDHIYQPSTRGALR